MNNQNQYAKTNTSGSGEELKAMQNAPYSYPNQNNDPYSNGLNREISGAINPSLSQHQQLQYNQPYQSYQPGPNSMQVNGNQQFAPPPPAYPNNYPPNYGQKGNTTQIIIQKNVGNYSNPCQYCHKTSQVTTRQIMGCATWGWGVALFWFTGICCWIPCVIDDCYDVEIIFQSCMEVRGTVNSKYCC